MLRDSVLTLPDVFPVTDIEHIITELCRSSWTLTCCGISLFCFSLYYFPGNVLKYTLCVIFVINIKTCIYFSKYSPGARFTKYLTIILQ